MVRRLEKGALKVIAPPVGQRVGQGAATIQVARVDAVQAACCVRQLGLHLDALRHVLPKQRRQLKQGGCLNSGQATRRVSVGIEYPRMVTLHLPACLRAKPSGLCHPVCCGG